MCKHSTFRSNWNLEMLVFMEGGKPEYPEKNPRSKDENRQQTQPTYDTETGNRTRATFMEGECSHHCAIPAPPNIIRSPKYNPFPQYIPHFLIKYSKLLTAMYSSINICAKYRTCRDVHGVMCRETPTEK